MEERLDWKEIYLDKCMENQDLKREIRILQEILRAYLPVISAEGDSEGNRNNK